MRIKEGCMHLGIQEKDANQREKLKLLIPNSYLYLMQLRHKQENLKLINFFDYIKTTKEAV